jgi:uncharacterized protein (TIGR03435 family)
MRTKSRVAGLASLLFLMPCVSHGQAPEKLEFEVASVRASAPQSGAERPVNGDSSGGPGTSDPTRLTFRRVPLGIILMTAFDVPANRLKAPEWTANVEIPITKNVGMITPTAARYDITATMLPGTTKAQAHEMLRNLLIDRFKLTYHFEKKNFDGYVATVANGGVKLRPSQAAKESEAEAAPLAAKFPLGPDGFAEVPPGEPAIVATIVDGSRKVRWSVRKVPVSSLLEMFKLFYPLAARLGDGESSAGYIFDDTGLTGTYDFKFEYPLSASQFGRALEYALGTPNFADRAFDISWKNIVRFQTAAEIKPDFAALAKEAVETEQPESDPALISAIEKQLGIKLVKSKIPLDVVTVDHIEKMPTEN